MGLALALLPASTTLAADATQQFLLLKLDGTYVKWGRPVLGTGAKVRYAFATRNMRFEGARNCDSMVPLDSPLQRFAIEPAQLHSEAAAAFKMWERAANISFEAVSDPDEADIVIGGQAEPRGRAFANVSYDRSPAAPMRRIEKALICLNPLQPWKVGFGGNASAYDLRYTIAHEIGHAIGLNHPGPSGQLMAFQYGEQFRDLQTGDMGGAITLYGSRGGKPATGQANRNDARAPDMGLR